MKYFYLLFLLVFPFLTFSQSTTEPRTVVTSSKTYGYVGGVRLDKLDAHYAEFENWGSHGLIFDYGQQRKNRKDLVVTDEKGMPLWFNVPNKSFLLNFLHYNKWHLTATNSSLLQKIND